MSEWSSNGDATTAKEASDRARGTTRKDRGVPARALNFDPSPKPIHIPSLLDKVKRVLRSPSDQDNELRRKQDALKAIDDQRKHSNPGRQDPPGTLVPNLPKIPINFLDGK